MVGISTDSSFRDADGVTRFPVRRVRWRQGTSAKLAIAVKRRFGHVARMLCRIGHDRDVDLAKPERLLKEEMDIGDAVEIWDVVREGFHRKVAGGGITLRVVTRVRSLY